MAHSVLKDPHLKDLRDDLELERWVTADDGRKDAYFSAADNLRKTIQDLSLEEASDDEVMDALAYTLRNDPVLRGHVRGQEGTGSLSDEEWREILRAAAGTILECQYGEQSDG